MHISGKLLELVNLRDDIFDHTIITLQYCFFRKGDELKAAKNGAKEANKDGRGKAGAEEAQNGKGRNSSLKKNANGGAEKLGNGKVNVMGRKIPNKRPLLTNGLKTLRVDEGLGPFSVRGAKEKDGVGASKVS